VIVTVKPDQLPIATPSKDGVAMEPREIQLRAYTTDGDERPTKAFAKPRPTGRFLIFDTETTTDASQQLRFGAFQIRDGDELFREGLFFDQDGLSESEIDTLRAYVHGSDFELMSKDDFVEEIFFKECADFDGTCIGFNLPFDLTRLAIGYGPAKGGKTNSAFHNGFSLKLSTNEFHPRVKLKQLGAQVALTQFAGTKQPQTNRQSKAKAERPKGFFADVASMASALLAQRHTLASLASALQVETQKSISDAHGDTLAFDYIDYAMNDVQCTWECFAALKDKLETHPLPGLDPHELRSEATLGKAYLRAMGIKSWQKMQPEFSSVRIGQIMSTYYGGRSEVNIRRMLKETVYCDFLSMYPTVNTLMGVGSFLVSNGMSETDVTDDVRDLLAKWTADDLHDPANWQKLNVLVQIIPMDDVLPVRSVYGDALPRNETNKIANIGLNRLTCETPLWFTLADCLASKFHTGKAPHIVQAIRFSPIGTQDDLHHVAINGDPDCIIDPKTDDIFKRVIQLRRRTVAKRKASQGVEREQFDQQQHALKIFANATSYGIFVEMIIQDQAERAELTRFGYDGQPHTITSKVIEQPGTYFHPLIATLITGAARLMLSLSEVKALEQGIEWVFCDTDGIAFVKPDDMPREEFIRRTLNVCDWFKPLNPYGDTASILQIEDENFQAGSTKNDADLAKEPPLYCYAVSAKRYALFNLIDDEVVIRKASAHGLGHLSAPYKNVDPEAKSDGSVAFWQKEHWRSVIEAALRGDDDNGAFITDERLQKPAASRYTANTPKHLKWFSKFNDDLPWSEQVRPCNFLLTFQAKKLERLATTDHEAASWLHNGHRPPKPAGPYENDPEKSASQAFDRLTGQSLPVSFLKTYADVLRDYHLHAETKFHGGFDNQRGKLQRRHINAVAVRHIGKEAHNWQEHTLTGDGSDIAVGRGNRVINAVQTRDDIRSARQRFGVRKLCRAAGVGDSLLKAACDGNPSVEADTLVRLLRAGHLLGLEQNRSQEAQAFWLARLKTAVDQFGFRAIAAALETDVSNLRKTLAEKRPISRLTGPRWRSHALCKHRGALDGRLIWLEPPHSGGRLNR